MTTSEQPVSPQDESKPVGGPSRDETHRPLHLGQSRLDIQHPANGGLIRKQRIHAWVAEQGRKYLRVGG